MPHDTLGDAPGRATPSASRPAPSLARITLDEEALGRLTPLQEADRAQAVADLEVENLFHPHGLDGPFRLNLTILDGRLVFDVRSLDDARLRVFIFALSPFRRLIKDYQLLVDSYDDAMQEGHAARVQTIDMGRRGLHNEGAEMMVQRLEGKVSLDFATARRLFTLVCVLHQRI